MGEKLMWKSLSYDFCNSTMAWLYSMNSSICQNDRLLGYELAHDYDQKIDVEILFQ